MTRISPLSPQAGFTLLEVLVSLTILAVAAAGLMSATRLTLRQQEALEIKTFSGWIAQNRLAELHATRAWPDIGESRDSAPMAGRQWDIQTTVASTSNQGLRRIVVDVSPASSHDSISLIGFVGRQ